MPLPLKVYACLHYGMHFYQPFSLVAALPHSYTFFLISFHLKQSRKFLPIHRSKKEEGRP